MASFRLIPTAQLLIPTASRARLLAPNNTTDVDGREKEICMCQLIVMAAAPAGQPPQFLQPAIITPTIR